MARLDLDRDVTTPWGFPWVLRAAAKRYRQDAEELSAALEGDGDVGQIWRDFAFILEQAAKSAEQAMVKRGL